MDQIKPNNEKVSVAVSQEFADFRTTQTLLNYFLWTTEMSYGYLLSDRPKLMADPSQPAINLLGHATTEAWYPNKQGNLKFADTIGSVFKQISQNTVHVYRAVIIYFFSAFEDYLDRRVGDLKSSNRAWGPYHRSLEDDLFTKSQYPLPIADLVLADFCREIRNRVVHPPFDLPADPHSSLVGEWRKKMEKISTGPWASQFNLKPNVIEESVDRVFGGVAREVSQAKANGKELPVELFYALFTFTNLTNLAFDIEEALITKDSAIPGKVIRLYSQVNRKELIIPDAKQQAK